jgi:hypothetical protein
MNCKFQYNLRLVPELALPFVFLQYIEAPEYAHADTLRIFLPRAFVK